MGHGGIEDTSPRRHRARKRSRELEQEGLTRKDVLFQFTSTVSASVCRSWSCDVIWLFQLPNVPCRNNKVAHTSPLIHQSLGNPPVPPMLVDGPHFQATDEGELVFLVSDGDSSRRPTEHAILEPEVENGTLLQNYYLRIPLDHPDSHRWRTEIAKYLAPLVLGSTYSSLAHHTQKPPHTLTHGHYYYVSLRPERNRNCATPHRAIRPSMGQ